MAAQAKGDCHHGISYTPQLWRESAGSRTTKPGSLPTVRPTYPRAASVAAAAASLRAGANTWL